MTILPANLSNRVSVDLVGEDINGCGLDVVIKVNGDTVDEINNLVGKHTIEFYKSYPMIIELVVSGKAPNDTQVDQHGNITRDKHVLVSNLVLSGVPIKRWLLEKNIVKCNNQNTNYLGFNGVATIHLPKKDAFDNHLYLLALGN